MGELKKLFKKSEDIDIVICAWTKKIKHNGNWMSLEDYLIDIHGINFSHGISPEAKEKVKNKTPFVENIDEVLENLLIHPLAFHDKQK